MPISAHRELTLFLKHPSNLHWLNLSQCHVERNSKGQVIGDPGKLLEMTQLLPQLANAFLIASPKNLSINTREFDLNAFTAIAKALVVPNNRVRTLELSTNSPAQGCEITPAMMHVLVEGFKKSPSLRELSLKNHYISSRAAKILADALPHTNISVCDLTDCGIKKNGLAALLRALPNTKLVYLGMYGSHYRTILRCPDLYGAINLTCSKAARKAVDSRTSLAAIEFPDDHYISNCRQKLREGKIHKDKSALKITNMLNEVHTTLNDRLEVLKSIANRLLRNQPLHLNSELTNYLQQGGDQAVRYALKCMLFERYQYSFICSREMEKKLNGLITDLHAQITKYHKATKQFQLFEHKAATPSSKENRDQTTLEAGERKTL